jgi:NAD(P)-dependent dehydrogenase (short-subunit alcohol dehydrogenase family)
MLAEKDHWTVEDIPDQRGRVALVTGANSGLGFQTARALAGKGASVLMACRNQEKGAEALARVKAEHPDAKAELLELDLADLSSVRRAANDALARHERLDLLINNAGVMAIPHRTTADGFEMQFGTNHLGHFALTGLLLDRILSTEDSRVVSVSSGAHRIGRMNFDDLQGERRYRKWRAYGQSKLANLLFTRELQRRLAASDASTIAVVAHPGYASTHLQTAGPKMAGSNVMTRFFGLANRFFSQSDAMGALPQLYAATAPTVVGGEFFGPDGRTGMQGYPTRVGMTRAARNDADARRLWVASEDLTGVSYDLLPA